MLSLWMIVVFTWIWSYIKKISWPLDEVYTIHKIRKNPKLIKYVFTANTTYYLPTYYVVHMYLPIRYKQYIAKRTTYY